MTRTKAKTAEHAGPETVAANIPEKTVCLKLQFHRFGTRRKVASDAVEVDADKGVLYVAKRILDAGAMKPIRQLDGRMKGLARHFAVPCTIAGPGIHLVPVGLVKRLDDQLTTLTEERGAAVEAFLELYPALKADAKKALRSLYREANYPSVDDLRAAFAVDWRWVVLTVPDQLKGIKSDLWEREHQKAEQRWVVAAEEIQQALREGFAELIERMVDRLQVDKTNGDVKPRVFRDTLVTNMTEFIELLKARNITDDQQLDQLAEQAQAVLHGVEPDDLRQRENVRSRVLKAFEQMHDAASQMVVQTRRRGIRFE